MKRVVVGIDLSLTGLALVAVPEDWDLQWSRLRRTTLTTKKDESEGTRARDQIARIDALSRDVCRWVDWTGATDVWIEGYPASGRVFNLDKLAELGGVVRHELGRMGLFAETSPQSSARKLVLGKLPRAKHKQHVVSVLKSVTTVFKTDDERDAFVAANWGLSELGMCCVIAPEPVT